MAYKRKTRDEYQIQGYYDPRTGWEEVTAEDTRKAAKEQLKCYRENEPGTPHRIVVKRVPIQEI